MPAVGVPWLWQIGSLLVAVLWASFASLLRRRRAEVAGHPPSFDTLPLSPWLLQLLRLLYYVGVPYAALLSGAVVERHLWPSAGQPADASGRWLDWARDIGWAIALGLAAFILLALAWAAYRRALAAGGLEGAVVGAHSSGWLHLREAAFHEVHWAFYRNAPIVAWGAYRGSWVGLALTLAEAALNPMWRKGLVDAERAPAQLMRAALAVVSSVLFLQAGNVWLAVIVHWGVSWGLAALVQVLPLLPARRTEGLPVSLSLR